MPKQQSLKVSRKNAVLSLCLESATQSLFQSQKSRGTISRVRQVQPTVGLVEVLDESYTVILVLLEAIIGEFGVTEKFGFATRVG